MSKEKKIALRKISITSVAFLIALILAWGAFENITLKEPLKRILKENSDLQNLSIDVSYKDFMSTDSLIFNLKKIGKPQEITPFIGLIKFAKEVNQRQFKKVYVQYKGKTKFIIDGPDFTAISLKAQIVNPENLITVFPSYLKSPEGNKLFTDPHGDPQWVQQKQIKNFRQICFLWYLNDWLKDAENRVAGTNSTPDSPQGTAAPNSSPTTEESAESVEIPLDTPAKAPEKTKEPAAPKTSPTPANQNGDLPIIEPEEIP